MSAKDIENRFNYLLGRITALELLTAGMLATADEERRKVAAAYLEMAYVGGLNSNVSEHLLKGFRSTKENLLSRLSEPPDGS
ncbi:hypothetical protein CY652_10440 [Burkholderia sp. WAC0059]|uniref:hypothetical protein n=1 Tax=Burkholderia sp. WAC0059 TaxID=2066022 RepID=UPI000C7EC36A|nr:hypothetical protein [Burkholderia sp. WAC0059]PLZ02526.1 hypothetical protein CY652_10440 [Burkholderia sp. WAC0059]